MSFFLTGPASPGYENVRDSELFADVRPEIERLWEQFEPLSGDGGFREDAKQKLNARTWEMYLADLLLRAGFVLERPPSGGPDIKIATAAGPIWIEATTAEPGVGQDRVERLVQHEVSPSSCIYTTDEPAMILRLQNAIAAKASQHGRFVQRGLIGPTDRFVVAINAGEVPDADEDDGLPLIVKAVYPFGGVSLTYTLYSDEPPVAGFSARSEVRARGGRAEPTNTFLGDWYSMISALVYSPRALWNVPEHPAQRGRELRIVHNLRAAAPLGSGTIPFGKEWRAEEDHLVLTDHRPPLEFDE